MHMSCFLSWPVVPCQCSPTISYLAGINVTSSRCAFLGYNLWPLYHGFCLHILLSYLFQPVVPLRSISFIFDRDQCHIRYICLLGVCPLIELWPWSHVSISVHMSHFRFWPIVPWLCSRSISYLAGIHVTSSRYAFWGYDLSLTFDLSAMTLT